MAWAEVVQGVHDEHVHSDRKRIPFLPDPAAGGRRDRVAERRADEARRPARGLRGGGRAAHRVPRHAEGGRALELAVPRGTAIYRVREHAPRGAPGRLLRAARGTGPRSTVCRISGRAPTSASPWARSTRRPTSATACGGVRDFVIRMFGWAMEVGLVIDIYAGPLLASLSFRCPGEAKYFFEGAHGRRGTSSRTSRRSRPPARSASASSARPTRCW